VAFDLCWHEEFSDVGESIRDVLPAILSHLFNDGLGNILLGNNEAIQSMPVANKISPVALSRSI